MFEPPSLKQNIGQQFGHLFADYYIPQPTVVKNIGKGVDAILNTLDEMKRIIQKSTQNYEVREFATFLIKDISPDDKHKEAETIFNWIRNNADYLYDPHHLEMIQSPLVAITKWKKGIKPRLDCDDFAILLGSIYKTIGLPVALRAAGYKDNKKFSHVYLLVRVKGKWVACDGIKKKFRYGFEAPGSTVLKDILV